MSALWIGTYLATRVAFLSFMEAKASGGMASPCKALIIEIVSFIRSES